MAELTRDISGLGLEELKALVVQALEENARLKKEIREEAAAGLNSGLGRHRRERWHPSSHLVHKAGTASHPYRQ